MGPSGEPLVGRAAARFADANAARAAALAFDLRHLQPDYYANPYPYYHALRQHAPVHRLPDGGYFLSRYADCVAVYKDVALYSSDKRREFRPKYGDSPLYEHHTTSLVFNDPPLHTRVRRIIAGAFTPRAIAAMEQPVVELVDGLLTRLAERGSGDLITDLAAAVPVEVIGNLLAVPGRAWAAARVVTCHPRCARAGADACAETAGRALGAEFVLHIWRDWLLTGVHVPGNPEQDVLTRLIQGEQHGEKLV